MAWCSRWCSLVHESISCLSCTSLWQPVLLLLREVCRSVLTSAQTPPPGKALGWREPIHLRKGSASLKVATSVMAVEFGRVFSRGCVGLRCRYFLDLKAGKWPSCAEMDRPGFRFVFWQDKRSFPVCRGQWRLHSFLIRFWSACFQAAKTFPQWLNLDDWSCMFVSRERLCHCRQWPLCACVCVRCCIGPLLWTSLPLFLTAPFDALVYHEVGIGICSRHSTCSFCVQLCWCT